MKNEVEAFEKKKKVVTTADNRLSGKFCIGTKTQIYLQANTVVN